MSVPAQMCGGAFFAEHERGRAQCQASCLHVWRHAACSPLQDGLHPRRSQSAYELMSEDSWLPRSHAILEALRSILEALARGLS